MDNILDFSTPHVTMACSPDNCQRMLSLAHASSAIAPYAWSHCYCQGYLQCGLAGHLSLSKHSTQGQLYLHRWLSSDGHYGSACNAQHSLQSLLRCSHLAAQELEGSITEMMPWNCWVVHSSQRVRSPSMVRKGQFSQPLCRNCKQHPPLELQRVFEFRLTGAAWGRPDHTT